MKAQLKLSDVPKIHTIQEMVLRSADNYAPKLALEDLNKTPISEVTYAGLLENILKFGSALKSLGLKERAHIAVIGENRVQWGISFLTLMSFNYVVVPIDRNLHENEILNIIHESDSEAIIYSEAFDQLLMEKKSSLKKLKHYISMDLDQSSQQVYSMTEMIKKASAANRLELPVINPEELAEIIFTSGSLGRAKGVMLSQKNLVSNLMDMVSMMFIYPEDRFMSVLPMHHTYECTCGFLCPLYSGASVHFARSLKTIVDDLQNVKATLLLAVPLLYDKMFKRISKTIKEKKVASLIINPLIQITNAAQKVGWKNAKKKIFKEIHDKFGGSIRVFIAGGAAPDPLVAKGLREFGFNFIQGYGLTETAPILTLNQINNFKDDSAGIPLPHVEIKINNPDADGIGEIYSRGPNTMLGYYKNEKLTNEVFDKGWFKTGDLGYFDEDGFLHVAGRKKNVIIAKNGKNVFPEEVEDTLNRSEYVLESLVFGEKDAKQGEIIAAQIFADAEAFITLCEMKGIELKSELIHEIVSKEVSKANEQLADYKRIKKFYIRDNEFEKTTTQKIKRYKVLTESVES